LNRGYDQTRTLEYYQRAIERLKLSPAVIDVTLASRPMLTGVNPQRTVDRKARRNAAHAPASS